ncbi:unnamed protein product [Pieris macdunnoughi]|uniref:EF-hand domain-containing protein n=1 Tax=Pieris macdunnoughi TaxID=345717 RepID=A0A821R1S9_9NEOP|nr:unnamed protein product [Pieris macdunnoughi]
MGNENSIPMELCSNSRVNCIDFKVENFDADEIRRLGKRFRKLDLDNSGALSIDEFMSLPELQQNPLVQRVIAIFDADGNGEVDFKEFIQGVSQFSVKGDKLSKLRFAFRIYDMDNDGYISNGELFQVLKMMVGNNLKDTQLQQIVDKTILFADKDEDGKISFEEFCSVVGNTDIHKKDGGRRLDASRRALASYICSLSFQILSLCSVFIGNKAIAEKRSTRSKVDSLVCGLVRL